MVGLHAGCDCSANRENVALEQFGVRSTPAAREFTIISSQLIMKFIGAEVAELVPPP